MAWCVSNVVVHRDGKDNIYPVKKKSRGRIDPVIAALMGRKLAAANTVVKPPDYSMVVLGGR
jgi:phage terminase large subunit-like protein